MPMSSSRACATPEIRRLTLPMDCRFDRAQANAEHGLVTIRIPKERPRAPEKIRIQVTRHNTD